MPKKVRTFSREEILRANQHLINNQHADRSSLPQSVAHEIRERHYTRDQLNQAFSKAWTNLFRPA